MHDALVRILHSREGLPIVIEVPPIKEEPCDM